jgi:hypothetical protein
MMGIETAQGKVLVGAYDLTTSHTSYGLTLAREAIESNCMLNDTAGTAKFMQTFLHGRKSFTASMSGYTNPGVGLPSTVLAAALGTAGTIITMTGATGAAGDPAYSAYATVSEHEEIGGSVGGMTGFAAAAFGEGTPCFRGSIMGIGAKTQTGNGNIVQLGAITAGTKALYAALHVTTVTGSDLTLDVDLFSSANADMSSPTERISFTQTAGITSEIKSLATAVTDTYWRATWTIFGTDPSFTIALNVGIITL